MTVTMGIFASSLMLPQLALSLSMVWHKQSVPITARAVVIFCVEVLVALSGDSSSDYGWRPLRCADDAWPKTQRALSQFAHTEYSQLAGVNIYADGTTHTHTHTHTHLTRQLNHGSTFCRFNVLITIIFLLSVLAIQRVWIF